MLGTPPSVWTPKVREDQATRALKLITSEEYDGLRSFGRRRSEDAPVRRSYCPAKERKSSGSTTMLVVAKKAA